MNCGLKLPVTFGRSLILCCWLPWPFFVSTLSEALQENHSVKTVQTGTLTTCKHTYAKRHAEKNS